MISLVSRFVCQVSCHFIISFDFVLPIPYRPTWNQVLTKEALGLIGDRWADLAHKTEMGSPYRKSKDDEVYFFSTQVTCGDDG